MSDSIAKERALSLVNGFWGDNGYLKKRDRIGREK
jgi:hypothetical protein